jgi:hypothetical protein
MHLQGPALGAPSPGIAHTIPSSVWINTAATATEWRAIVLLFFRTRGGATVNMTYFRNARRLYVTYIFFCLTYFWVHLFQMADDAGNARPKRTLPPNSGELKKAQQKFPTFNAAARTEYERLKISNEESPLLPNKNPVEHARWCHLSDLKSKCELVLFFYFALGQ